MLAYYPYFRGKQYELICIRESASLLSASGFIPIIELVRADTSSLVRCLNSLEEYGSGGLIISRPAQGPLKAGLTTDIRNAVSAAMQKNPRLGWLVRVEDILTQMAGELRGETISVLHDSAADAAKVVELLTSAGVQVAAHIFVDGNDAGSLYRARFKESKRIIIRDGFKRKKNADYLSPEIEPFSELYLTHIDERMQGFGDFLTVGSYYSEGGGQAYAVAIHITFKDEDADGAIFVHHFVSDSNDTPADPAAKFHEALSKLVAVVTSVNSKIQKTSAVNELIDLHGRRHYPGLGYVKKLSMRHHLELMAGLW